MGETDIFRFTAQTHASFIAYNVFTMQTIHGELQRFPS